jgi:pimeloyl-ACP methyl ester carboxylesterase
MPRRLPWGILVALLIAASIPSTLPASDAVNRKTKLKIQGQSLDLHLRLTSMAAETRPSLPLVLYASGDGGWFGVAVEMFNQIADLGYPTVGFSSRQFLKLNRKDHRLVTAEQLAEEYAAILSAAREVLGLADSTPSLLTGWSRGASFAVLAASEPPIRDHAVGVVAIGLTEREELQIVPPSEQDDDDEPPSSGRTAASTPGTFDTYGLISHLAPLRCAVIQATGDKYLPAASAQRLFGSDSDLRKFFAVAASNHRFSGGREAFAHSLAAALQWVRRTDQSLNRTR